MQIQSGKTNEKSIERRLKGVPSVKDLNIAEQLERLKQFNRKNNNDDDDDSPPPTPNFDPTPYYPPSPSKDDSDIEGDLNLTQKFLLGDRPQKENNAVAV